MLQLKRAQQQSQRVRSQPMNVDTHDALHCTTYMKRNASSGSDTFGWVRCDKCTIWYHQEGIDYNGEQQHYCNTYKLR